MSRYVHALLTILFAKHFVKFRAQYVLLQLILMKNAKFAKGAKLEKTKITIFVAQNRV